jgi:hypothetical protein
MKAPQGIQQDVKDSQFWTVRRTRNRAALNAPFNPPTVYARGMQVALSGHLVLSGRLTRGPTWDSLSQAQDAHKLGSGNGYSRSSNWDGGERDGAYF